MVARERLVPVHRPMLRRVEPHERNTKASHVNARLCGSACLIHRQTVEMRFSGSAGFRIVFDRVFDHALECGDHLLVRVWQRAARFRLVDR